MLGHGTSREELLSIHTGLGSARRGERPTRPAESSEDLSEVLNVLDTVADDFQARMRRSRDAEAKRDDLHGQLAERDRRFGQALGALDLLVDELSAALREQTSMVEHLAGSVEATSGTDAPNGARDLALETERSAESMLRAAEEIRRLEGSATKAIATLSAVRARTDSMREALGDVEQMIRQAELLAINVDILAGNAGESTRAFDVAAQAMKELTDGARDATRLLAHLVEATATEARSAGDALARDAAGVERVARTSSDAERMLHELAALHRSEPTHTSTWREAATLVERIRELSHAHERRAVALAESLQRLRTPNHEAETPA